MRGRTQARGIAHAGGYDSAHFLAGICRFLVGMVVLGRQRSAHDVQAGAT